MNKRLEGISDKIRMGEPVDFLEALEVIEYQNRNKSLWVRIKEWIRFNL